MYDYPPPQAPQPPPDDVDAMMRSMKRANWKPLLVGLGVVAAVVVGGGLWVLESFASARADLEADGYTNPEVKIKGPFTFAFSATKGSQSCSGSMTRFPGSSSTQEVCFDTTISAPPPVALSNRQEIEKSLEHKGNYAKLGFTRFTCPEIADSDTKVTCTVATDGGASVGVTVERTKVDTDGSWGEWSMTPQTHVRGAEDLAETLTKALSEKVKRSHPKGVDVDCGKGPAVFVGGKFTCTATTRDATPKKANVVLTDNDAGYDWTANL